MKPCGGRSRAQLALPLAGVTRRRRHLRARHRAHRLSKLRPLPSPRRSRTVFAAELQRREEPRAPDRRCDPPPLHAALAPEAGLRRLRGRTPAERRADPPDRRLGRRRARPKAIRPRPPPLPDFKEGWQLGPPDLILEAQAAYTLPASGPDVYWNFIIPQPSGGHHALRARHRDSSRRQAHRASRQPVLDRARSARRQEIAEGARLPGHGCGHRSHHFRSRRRPFSVLEARRRRLTSSRTASRGGSIPATIWFSTRTCSPPASPNRCGPRSACTSPISRRSSSRCWCSWSTTARSISRRESAISSSPTISACRSTWMCWPFIRTRTIWGTCSKATPRCPMASANG